MKIMENKRFFAFGCSYTSYNWPTWADIIGYSYESNYYNCGKSGAGNIYIFNMLMQVDQMNKLTKDDLVIIQWSSITREDRYVHNNWITKGGLLNYYPEDYINKYCDMRGFFIRDIAMIKAAKDLLEKIGCEFYFISMCGIGPSDSYDDTVSTLDNAADRDVTAMYKDVLDIIRPSFYSVERYAKRPLLVAKGVYLHDSHRMPSEHLEYIKTVLPEFSPKDDEFVKDADRQLIEALSTDSKNTKYRCWSRRIVHNTIL